MEAIWIFYEFLILAQANIIYFSAAWQKAAGCTSQSLKRAAVLCLVGVPVEVHFIDFRVVVLNLGVRMADEDREVGQAALQREHLGKAADVFADAVHQTLNV